MGLKARAFLENALCVLLLAGLAVAVLYPVWRDNAVPEDLHAIFSLPPWEEAAPEGVEAAPDEKDWLSHRHYPWRHFLAASSQSGESLLWNPLENGGLPFLALWRSRVLSPFSAPYYFLPTDNAILASLLLKLLAAGWCAFYVARRLGFAPPIALLAASIFQCSAPLLLYSGWPISDAYVWFPILIVFAERMAVGQRRHWPLGALIAALMILGGDPETMVMAVLFALGYLLLRLRGDGASMSEAFAAITPFAAAIAAAIGLTAAQLLPYAEFVRQAANSGATPMENAPGLTALAALFFPGAASGAREMSVHFGLVPLVLLALWAAVRRFVLPLQRARTESLLVMAGLFTLAGLGLAPWLTGTPILNALNTQHFMIGNAFAAAIMVAAAADEWVVLDAEQCKKALLRLGVTVPALAALGGGAYVLARIDGPEGAQNFDIALAAGVSAAAGVLLIFTLLKPSGRFLGYALTGVSSAALLIVFTPAMGHTAKEDIFPETDFIRALQEHADRVSGNQALQDWPLAGNGVPQIFGSSGVQLRRQARFAELLEDDPLLLRRGGSPVLLLTKPDIEGPFMPVRRLLRIGEVFPTGALLFSDLETTSRARIAYDFRSVAGYLGSSAASDEPVTVEYAGAMPPASEIPPQPASIEEESNTEVRIRVEQTQPGVLVLADAWYPGWQATVNGEPATVFPVDGVFRGVRLPEEGDYDVVFYYDPLSVRAGFTLSGLFALIVAAGLFQLFRNRNAASA